MRVRESGMPDEAEWETLFDVPLILDRLGIDDSTGDVVEIGCGYGTFTLPVAERVSGRVVACDVEPAMVERTRARAKAAGLTDVDCSVRDVLADGLPVDDADVCLVFNLLHGEDPVALLDVAARGVDVGGEVHAIHWRRDPATPRGPPMAIRPEPGDLAAWAVETGMLEVVEGPIDLPPWHVGWRFRRTE